uniref:histidine kinase n=1 Tax=Oryza rufipogon TaxID=4529 RepID=A0A0E0PW86_ORYRU
MLLLDEVTTFSTIHLHNKNTTRRGREVGGGAGTGGGLEGGGGCRRATAARRASPTSPSPPVASTPGGCHRATAALMQCQRVSDLLIVASFLSFPFELFYFATCADLSEVKCAVLHFCAFIVLCGATNLLATFTHALPHSAPLLRALTTAKVTEASYTILVLLPPHDAADGWSSHDLEIVQAVARVSSASVVD